MAHGYDPLYYGDLLTDKETTASNISNTEH